MEFLVTGSDVGCYVGVPVLSVLTHAHKNTNVILIPASIQLID